MARCVRRQEQGRRPGLHQALQDPRPQDGDHRRRALSHCAGKRRKERLK